MDFELSQPFRIHWREYLIYFNVPIEKYEEFYKLFGEYLCTNTAEDLKTKAFAWITANRNPTPLIEKLSNSKANEFNANGT